MPCPEMDYLKFVTCYDFVDFSINASVWQKNNCGVPTSMKQQPHKLQALIIIKNLPSTIKLYWYLLIF